MCGKVAEGVVLGVSSAVQLGSVLRWSVQSGVLAARLLAWSWSLSLEIMLAWDGWPMPRVEWMAMRRGVKGVE